MKTVLLIVVMSLTGILTAQQAYGTIQGQVTEKATGLEMIGVRVQLYQGGNPTTNGAITDLDGKYSISKIAPGSYELRFKYISFQEGRVEKIIVTAGKTSMVNFAMEEDVQILECVEVKSSVRKSKEVSAISIQKLSSKNVSRVAAGVASTKGRRTKKYKSTPKPIDGGNGKVSKSNRNKYSEFKENEFIKVQTEALSTFSIDVDNASYTIMRTHINNGTKPPSEAIRIEEMINYFKYKYESPKDDKPFAVNYEIADSPWSENKIVKIGLKGKTFEDEKAPRNNLVFLLDVSGSMSSENKLGYVQKSMKMLVNALSDKDKISIVTYAGYSATVLKPTSCSKKDEIFDAIDKLSAGGSTNGAGGINRAYDLAEKHFMNDGNNRIILCTDGDFNVGVSTNGGLEKLIEKKRKSGVFLTVCGFGMGNLQDQFMETLADKGNGNYYYIDNLLESKKVFQEDFTSTIHTIAKDVKIQVEFNPKHVKSYRLIGYDNRKLNKEDFLDDTKDAGELGAGHTVTALYEVVLKDDDKPFENELKYQDSKLKDGYENELMTVKLRYKKPDEDKSTGFEVPVINEEKEISKDFQFAMAVTQFGMILRKSKFKGEANVDDAIELAKKGKGEDDNGYRAEFIRLMEMYQVNLAEK